MKQLKILSKIIKWWILDRKVFLFAKKIIAEMVASGTSDKDEYKLLKKNIPSLKRYTKEIKKLTKSNRHIIISSAKNFENILTYFQTIKKAERFGLSAYINIEFSINIILKKENLDDYFSLATKFMNFDLEENSQGSFKKLSNYTDINIENKKTIVDILIKTKLIGHPLTQREVISYYNSHEKLSTDLENLKEAWLLAHEYQIEDISIKDFIRIVEYERKPKEYIQNLFLIKKHKLGISRQMFDRFRIGQARITKLIHTIIKLKDSYILEDIDQVYIDIDQELDVELILEYLLKLYNSSVKDIDKTFYSKFREIQMLGGDIKSLYLALQFNSINNIIEQTALFEDVKKITISASPNSSFNALSFIKSVDKLFNAEPDISMTDKENRKNTIVNDYIAGFDVMNILMQIKNAKDRGIEISYEFGKIIEQFGGSIKKVVEDSTNPFILKNTKLTTDSEGNEKSETLKLQVTTKDNIEILIATEIQVVMIPDNYFSGSDKDILFERTNAILTDEIQRRYNHDEIIANIEKISNNVLFRLENETNKIDVNYIEDKNMLKVSNDSHGHGHDEHGKHDEHKHEGQKHEEQKHEEQKHEEQKHEEQKHEEQKHEEQKHEEQKHEEQKHEPAGNLEKEGKSIKFSEVSKYRPLKVLIPKIDYIESTFKELDKIKLEYDHKLQESHLHIEKLKTEIEVEKKWGQGDNIKYRFLEDKENRHGHGHGQ